MSSVEKYRDLFTESDVETLREYAEALMATSEELQEIRKQVAEEVINNFDAWAEKVDKATEAFERLNNVLDHYKNIIGLIGKASLGISNDMIKDLNNTAVKNSINQLAASREYLEDL
jgi:predicted AAA+ superfamily ATPase